MNRADSGGPRILLPFAGLQPARFLERRKRFTVLAENGSGPVSIHTNNTGSMLGLLRPGCRIWWSQAQGPGRKLAGTLELTDFHGTLCGVNTSTPLRLLEAAWRAGFLPEAQGYTAFRREVTQGASRLDARLDGPGGPCFVECKNVTLVEGGEAMFPDAVSERAVKHLAELAGLAASGVRAALFLLVQRGDGRCFGPADLIDPAWARAFAQALDAGVEAWTYRAAISLSGIGLGARLPVRLP